MDSLLSLAFSMEQNKGVYALLLGSGISRSAGIPTGWEIVIDLINKVMASEVVSMEVDPVEWYVEKYNKEPEYGDLLSMVAKYPAERQQLIERYFVPTEEEREDGVKLPTPAHREIARLVSEGYIRVILTTNFDRLLEIALQDAGITPTVISNDDSAVGAVPMIHSACTIVKIHGDYKDTRIKNTNDELSSYSDIMNSLLNRVFDEFGLVVCGWSGEWDEALRNALYRRANRRYPFYWTSLSELHGKAKECADFLQAEWIQIKDADAFFSDLAIRVGAIADRSITHPLSVASTVAVVKKYLSKEEYRIRLFDFISEEINHAAQNIRGERNSPTPGTNEEIEAALIAHENSVDRLCHVFANGCFFDEDQKNIWYNKIADFAFLCKGKLNCLEDYPALLAYYAAGISCVYTRKYTLLFLLMSKSIKPLHSETKNACEIYQPLRIMEGWSNYSIFDKRRDGYELSFHLCKHLRQYFAGLIASDEEYEYAFDTFEYLNCLVDTSKRELARVLEDVEWIMTGRFVKSRRSLYYGGHGVEAFMVNNKILDFSDLLNAGFFDSDQKTLDVYRKPFVEWVLKIRTY